MFNKQCHTTLQIDQQIHKLEILSYKSFIGGSTINYEKYCNNFIISDQNNLISFIYQS